MILGYFRGTFSDKPIWVPLMGTKILQTLQKVENSPWQYDLGAHPT